MLHKKFLILIIGILLIFSGLSDAKAADVTASTGEIVTLSIRDYSSTGSNIYNDLLNGDIYSVSYSWTCSGNCTFVDKYNTYAYVKFDTPGNYTVAYNLKYSFPGAPRSYSFSAVWNVSVKSSGPTSIVVTANEYSLKEGKYTICRATLSGGNSSISWSTSNNNVSISPNGTTCTVTAINPGTKSRITAKTSNGLSDYVDITIKDNCTISLTPEKLTLLERETKIVSAEVSDNYNGSVRWSVQNTSIASVNNSGNWCSVTGLSEGNTTLYARLDDGTESSCSVTVNPANTMLTNLNIVEDDIIIKIGEELQLTANLLPDNATDPSIEWKSSNPNIVSVSSDGKIKGIRQGWSIIECQSKDGSELKSSILITVVAQTSYDNNYTDLYYEGAEKNGKKLLFTTFDNETYYLHLSSLSDEFFLTTNGGTLKYGSSEYDQQLNYKNTIRLSTGEGSPISSIEDNYVRLIFHRPTRDLSMEPYSEKSKEYHTIWISTSDNAYIGHKIESGKPFIFAVGTIEDKNIDNFELSIREEENGKEVPYSITEDKRYLVTAPINTDIRITYINKNRK